MKKFFGFFILITTICSLKTQAQDTETGFFLEEYAYANQQEVFPTVFANMTHKFDKNDQIGMWSFLLVSKKARKGSVGIFYTPKIADGVLKMGLSCGIKGTITVPNEATFFMKSFLFAKKGRFSFLNSLDYGDRTGYWYTGLLMVDVNNQLACGLRGQRFEGVGPVVEFRIKPLIFWFNGVYDFEFKRYGVLVGVNIKVETP